MATVCWIKTVYWIVLDWVLSARLNTVFWIDNCVLDCLSVLDWLMCVWLTTNAHQFRCRPTWFFIPLYMYSTALGWHLYCELPIYIIMHPQFNSNTLLAMLCVIRSETNTASLKAKKQQVSIYTAYWVCTFTELVCERDTSYMPVW